MIMGGVPYYLNQLDSKKSIAQNIDEICFSEGGILYEEFPRIFNSLFDSAELNTQIVEEISKKRYGIAFGELSEKVHKKPGEGFKKD